MSSFFTAVLDFLFPPSPETIELRSLSPADVFLRLPAAPSPAMPFITSLFAYKDPLVSELISSIKNKKDGRSLKLGAYALHEKIKYRFQRAVLVPVPVSKKRRRERGYNQCELLIDEIVKIDGERRFEKRFDILFRSKHTSDQKLKNREERLSEVGDIFTASGRPMADPIVIIDDVTTTGSTLYEARRALLEAGYKNVFAFTLAH